MGGYAAFLRAINVGGRRIQMDRLRALFDGLGFSGVDTYLASGNVVFRADGRPEALEEQIEAHLGHQLDYEVPTFVRSMSVLERVGATSAFDEITSASSKRYVVFLNTTLGEEEERILTDLQNDVDHFFAKGREIFWHRDLDAGDSMPTSEVEAALGVVATRRTLTTVQRLVAKYGSS